MCIFPSFHIRFTLVSVHIRMSWQLMTTKINDTIKPWLSTITKTQTMVINVKYILCRSPPKYNISNIKCTQFFCNFMWLYDHYILDSHDYFQYSHDDVIKWKYFLRYWPFVLGIHRSPVNPPQKGQCRGALMFSLICVWINGWVNNREAGDLRRYRAHYDVIVMRQCCFTGLRSNVWSTQ